ncbi:MAG: triose-phosphate isomerase, partial [Chloroflexota bacterium]
EIIAGQLIGSLAGIRQPGGLVIAYEPIWAIGTGRAATGEQANQTIGFIRQSLAGLLDKKLAREMRLLYGGSVTAANAAEFLRQPEIDGALVGGASLKADQFLSIVQQAAETRN